MLYSIDKIAKVSYYIHMIKTIKNKYETFTPGEFLPIYKEGVLTNRKDFHMYKIKKVARAADNAFISVINRAYGK